MATNPHIGAQAIPDRPSTRGRLHSYLEVPHAMSAPRSNLAPWDRAVRLVLGSALLYLGWFVLAGAPALVVDGLGAVFAATGILGVCPIYGLCGIVTRETRGDRWP